MTASHRWITYLTAVLAAAGTQRADAADILFVESGLVPYQVVQCDDAGQAALDLAGRVEAADATVQARIQRGAETLRDWADCASPEAGKWTAHFDAVPAGGPYTIELRARDAQGQDLAKKAVDHVLVGDLWILAGQSNMQGVGNNVDVTPPSDQVNVFAMNDTWRIAEEPIHRLEESADVVHNGIEDDAKRQGLVANVTNWTKGAGLGLPFAVELSRLTGRPVGLVACAHGGTSMGQWDPAKRDEGGRSLYGSMYRRFQAVGGKVRGVLWYQGESDANPDAAPIFADLFKNIVQSMRTDFGNAELPFYYVQIGRFTNPADAKDWNRAQQVQLDCESQIPHSAMVTSINLSLDDGIHIGTQGLKVLGTQFARIAARDLFKAGTVQNGPRPVSAKRNGSPFGMRLLVTFSGVNGGLKSDGRVAGFSVSDAEGNPLPNVYDAEISPVDPNTVIVWLSEAPAGAKLWYGRGFDPYCNLTDKEGMGVPVFGPMEISD
ncbi:MAG: sialate O-acetylesterase [FCB group bacterium]|nr:sialate O-acetylesterase [FCB group bacterium]